jgi:hypothetical protein
LSEYHKISEENNDPRSFWTIADLEKNLYEMVKEGAGKFIVVIFNTGHGFLRAHWRVTPAFIKRMEKEEP